MALTQESSKITACLNHLLFGIYFLCQTVTLALWFTFPFFLD